MNVLRLCSTVLLCLALFGEWGREVQAQSNYKEITVLNGGTIRGSVRLAGDIPPKIQLVVTKDANYCGTNKPSPRLRFGKSKGVQDAIVWLEGISCGKRKTSGDRKLVLDQNKCQYTPHIVVLPFGSSLDIVNSDPILHNVHAYDQGENARTLFNIAQPVRGQRTTVKQTLFRKPGLFLASCDAGHPWMNAYIMVAENPYCVLTDAQGGFVLDGVPPGTYKLKMWHEGVAIVRTEMENGKPKAYRYEEPYEIEREVTVPPDGSVSADFALTLRPAPQGVNENRGGSSP